MHIVRWYSITLTLIFHFHSELILFHYLIKFIIDLNDVYNIIWQATSITRIFLWRNKSAHMARASQQMKHKANSLNLNTLILMTIVNNVTPRPRK